MGFRGFIAIEVGGLSKLLLLNEELKRARGDLKLVDADNIHLTVKFLGDVNEDHVEKLQKAMHAAVKKVEPFDLSIQGLGFFPNENDMRVIWVGVDKPEPVAKIFEGVEKGVKKLGYRPDDRAYTPHITIARVRSQSNRPRVKAVVDAHQGEVFGTVRVDTLFLKKSFLTNEGPVYTTVATARLGE